MKYTIVIHQDINGGYWAEAPALPGCVSQGETLEELKENIREAIEGYLEPKMSDSWKKCNVCLVVDKTSGETCNYVRNCSAPLSGAAAARSAALQQDKNRSTQVEVMQEEGRKPESSVKIAEVLV